MPLQFCSSPAPALSGSRLPPRTWPSGQPEPAVQPLCLFSPLLTPQLCRSPAATASLPHVPHPHPGFQDSAQGYSLSWDALPTSSCGSAQMSLYRQEAPVALPAEVPSWHCMWPWDRHSASTLHWRQLCCAEWAWGDQRLWVSPGQSRVGGSSSCQGLMGTYSICCSGPLPAKPRLPAKPPQPSSSLQLMSVGLSPAPGDPPGSASQRVPSCPHTTSWGAGRRPREHVHAHIHPRPAHNWLTGDKGLRAYLICHFPAGG